MIADRTVSKSPVGGAGEVGRESMRLAAVVLTAFALAAAPSAAHHSNAQFDMTQTVTFEGVVTRYEWANPHVYIWIEAPDESGAAVEWLIEGQPPSVLRRQNWSADTLNVGDAVAITGNPSRNPAQKTLFMMTMEKADAALYDRESFLSTLMTSDAPPGGATASGLDGVWVSLLDLAAMEGVIAPAGSYALTDAGAAAAEQFDEFTMSPALSCIPYPAPIFMIAPDVKRITVEDGSIRIEGEFDDAARTIHLEDPTGGSEPSVQGYSVGRWEGSTLVIETSGFTPHLAGNAMSLYSSEHKRLVERLTLDADGTGLAYEFELTDPEVLAAPATGSNRWVYRPDLAFEPVACDLRNARRFAE